MLFDLPTAQAIQTAESADNGLPSPGSLELTPGVWTNVCPRCRAPALPKPWRCSKCEWVASKDPKGCCTAIHDVVPYPKDPKLADYPVDAAEVDAAKAKPVAERSEKEKALAVAVVVEEKPPEKPPEDEKPVDPIDPKEIVK